MSLMEWRVQSDSHPEFSGDPFDGLTMTFVRSPTLWWTQVFPAGQPMLPRNLKVPTAPFTIYPTDGMESVLYIPAADATQAGGDRAPGSGPRAR